MFRWSFNVSLIIYTQRSRIQYVPFVTVEGMESEQKLVETMTFINNSVNNEKLYLAGIVFDDPDAYDTAIPFNVSYTIR